MDKIPITLQDTDTGLYYTTHFSQGDASKLFSVLQVNTVNQNKSSSSNLASSMASRPSSIASVALVASNLASSMASRPSSIASVASAASTVSAASTASTLDIENPEAEQDSIFKWSHKAILLLIDEYRKREGDTVSDKVSQKQMWKFISDVLRKYGHDVTGPQCQSKFNGMKRTFKSVKDYNSKSGNNLRAWAYTEVMESLLDEKPFMNPIAVASSSGPISTESDVSLLNNVGSDSDSSSSCKRKSSHITEFIKIRKMAEESKEKRHQQKMDQQIKLLNAMNKLIDKLQ